MPGDLFTRELEHNARRTTVALERTLQRRLQEEGSSFQQTLDAAGGSIGALEDRWRG